MDLDWEAETSGNSSGIGRLSLTSDSLTARVLAIVESAGARRVLEIGCGDGFFARFAKRERPEYFAALEYVGIDRSEAAIETARRHVPEKTFVCGRYDTLEAGPADAIVSIDALLERVPSNALLHRLAATLGSGGVCVAVAAFAYDAARLRLDAWRAAAGAVFASVAVADVTELNMPVARGLARLWAMQDDGRAREGAEILASMAEGSYHHALFEFRKETVELRDRVL